MGTILAAVLYLALLIHILLLAVVLWKVWRGENIIDRLMGADLLGTLTLAVLVLLALIAQLAFFHVPIGRISNIVRSAAIVIAAITSCTNTSNPRNVIAAGLSSADPENAGAYFANAAAAREEMDSLKAEITATLAPVEGKRFIVFHDAYQYFERRFGLTGDQVDGDLPASGR